MLGICLPIVAQQVDEINLKEVEVKAARFVLKPDGRLIFPSDAQKNASTSGFSLINKLALPGIRVDETLRTVTSIRQEGTVQLHINGIIATKEELLSMEPKAVKSIHFIDQPGIRYGTDVAFVIDIRVQKAANGYVLGFDGVNSVTTYNGDNSFYYNANHNNSEIGVTYDFGYNDFRGERTDEAARYELVDGSLYTVQRNDETARNRYFGHCIQLKYNLADSASYVFQTRLSTAFSRMPDNNSVCQITTPTQSYKAFSEQKDKDFTPILDLYFFRDLGKHQSVTANMVGTFIRTDLESSYNEGAPYAYSVAGNSYSLISEAIYENRLKPFLLSLGFNGSLKYTRNSYQKDVSLTDNLHHESVYCFAEIKGKLFGANYTADIGVSNQRYRQDENRYNYWLWRPKLTLSYPFLKVFNVKYGFEMSEHMSQMANISRAEIRQNSMEWTVGNPELRPYKRTSHTFSLDFEQPRISSGIKMEYRINSNCSMDKYVRTADNRFLYSKTNQQNINMLYVNNYTRWDMVPEKLSVMVFGGIYRFFNQGDDYRHYHTSYNYGANVQAYLNQWTITGYADNGWEFIEGEHLNRNHSAIYLTVSYRVGAFEIGLFCQHPFQKNPIMNSSKVLNRYLNKETFYRNSSFGNMISLNFAWKFTKGRQYKQMQRTMNNKDTDTGILK